MKLLIITQNYLPFIGGIETQAQLIAHDLTRRHQVRLVAGNFAANRQRPHLRVLHNSLLTPPYTDYQDGPLPVIALTPQPSDRVRMLPIAMRCLPGLRDRAYHPLRKHAYGFFRPVYLPRLRQLLQGVDVVHAMAGDYIAWTAREAAQQLGIPFVCTPYVHPHQWGDGPEDVDFYRQCDAVIALLESDRQYLESIGVQSERLHTIGVIPVLPPTTDPQGFRARHALAQFPFVLYIGRMMPQKGAEAILKAASQVWERAPQTRFVFIGPGTPESETWFQQVDPRIINLGKVDDQEKADALDACSLFCMPSMSEILPAVYLEAWSYGKAVIGGKAHGLPELIEGNGGGITVSQDPDAVAHALLGLLLDPKRRACLGERGKTLVDRCYAKNAVVGSLETLYTQLRTQSSPASGRVGRK